jgi:hypothetical protein
MKKINYFLAGIGIVLVTIVACEKSAIEIDELSLFQDEHSIISNKQIVFDSPILLSGETHGFSYAVKEHRVVVPWEEDKLICEATLTKVKGQNYVLETKEFANFGWGVFQFREYNIDVKITPSGIVSFSLPEIWRQFVYPPGELSYDHDTLLNLFYSWTGCVPFGSGINKGTWNYKGYFDGTTFYAKSNFSAKQEMEGESPDYKNPLIDGPVQFEYSFELEVVGP